MFLYPERRIIRDILTFLLEKVPKTERVSSVPTRTATDAVNIARRVLQELIVYKGKGGRGGAGGQGSVSGRVIWSARFEHMVVTIDIRSSKYP